MKKKTLPNTKYLTIQIVDIDTAEILFSSKNACCFFCGANGETYLKQMFDSLLHYLRDGVNLRFELFVYPPITCADLERDVFEGIYDLLDFVPAQ